MGKAVSRPTEDSMGVLLNFRAISLLNSKKV
jgi:hypothetical protein